MHIGIDDTDSKEGMCTTYVGAVIIDELKYRGVDIVGYPKLIRLNPLWKHKTRGNCSVSFSIDTEENKIQDLKRMVLNTVEELADLKVETTTPGVAFYEGDNIPGKLRSFSKRVVREVVTIREAEEIAEKTGAEIHKFRIGRGVIGALASIGHQLEEDWTFELIAYRIKENWGKPRRVDERSVWEMDSRTYPRTFDNLDSEAREIHITPHTPCPILYGIRGETPRDVINAQEIVKEREPIERTIIYKTNQGTDEHFKSAKIEDAKPYHSVIIDGEVIRKPETIVGGHVIFTIQDETGKSDCAAYEPTRQFRDIIRKIEVGDKVRVYGGIKEKPELPLTINLEKIEILELTPKKKKLNPTCEECGRKMKSAGKNKGYTCRKCRINLPEKAAEIIEVKREIERGLHEVPPRARRHLGMPLIRVNSPSEEN